MATEKPETRYLFHSNKALSATLWRTVEPLKLTPALGGLNPNVEIVRYKARKGTRAAALEKKKALKQAQANKPTKVPKYLQRKTKVSADQQRTRCTDENWLESQPVDNVYNMKLYRGKPYTFIEAIDILRGKHVPSLINEPSALVKMTVELDLKTKKSSKFVDDFDGIITFPQEFDSGHENKIIAISKDPGDQVKSTDAGAIYTGSTALIKQILSGVIAKDDFDYVICHPDMLKEMNVLRGILKTKFPSLHNGFLRMDVDRAVASAIKAVEYKLVRSVVEQDFGWVNVSFGRLDMPLEQLEENMKHALNVIEKKHKPSGTNHILFNVRTLLWCERSSERLKIPHWEYLPNYPENGVLVEDDDESAESVN